MHDKYYKVHRYERTIIWLIELDDYAKELCSIHSLTFELCSGDLNFQCMCYHDRIMAKYYDDMITFII